MRTLGGCDSQAVREAKFAGELQRGRKQARQGIVVAGFPLLP